MNNLERPMNCKARFILLLIFPTVIVVTFSSDELQYQKQIDAEALLQFKMSVKMDPTLSLSNWVDGNNICNWTGITCDRNQRVVSVVLKYKSLAGTIPPHITNLSFLTILDLSHNHFFGQIPHELGKLGKLQYIKLYENKLQGSVPVSLCACKKLLELQLNDNFLSGSVPPDLGSFYNLQKLNLSSNSLSGIIPQDLANCTALKSLDLGENLLTGAIPFQFSVLRDLRVLILRANHLLGKIPRSLSNCTNLHWLSLTSNALEGPIPSEILTKLTRLQYLYLGFNSLSGAIPPELGLLTRLQELELGGNRFKGNVFTSVLNCTQLQVLAIELSSFAGSIPADIDLKLPNLQGFFAGGNQFSGVIPKSLGNCSQLLLLDLSDNLLSGVVPQELGKLSALQTLSLGLNSLSSGHCATVCVLDVLSNCSILERLDLRLNNFSGTLSRGIGNLSPRLSKLYLWGNNITGNIPEEIGNLTGLIILSLRKNSLIGNVPNALGLLKNLQMLDLSSNKLQGSIPSGFNMLVNVEYLRLQINHISGDIPSYLGSLQQLRGLDLSHNKLTGRIPNAIGQCFRLEMIDLSYNSLSGNIPIEISSLHSLAFYLNFSHNLLTGRLPSLGGMQQIQAIDISANELSGPIPGDIGSCVVLQYLNLSKNKLEGRVPTSIGQLKSLESIDLSFNELSGPVPGSIANLTMLRHLNLSYNNLNGTVPNQGAFRNLSAASFWGNLGLCAASGWLNLPNCTSSAKNHNGFNRNIVLVASIGTVFALCCTLGAFYIFYRRIKRTPISYSLLAPGFMQISSEELHRATQGFSAANLLGEGSFGSVYKGLLYDKTWVAVKVFDQDPQNSYKNFVRECRILSQVRHRNLVKILSSCSNEVFRALVLEFMSKGSLEQHLHMDGKQCRLSLKMRVNIALDVAHGMAYLHHHCSPPVVHCDLKPSNVLMDETMTAHVADFGISRLLTSPVSANSSTSRLKGTVGYLAPEYGLGGQVGTKGDVYSFGMLILEMVTKKRPTDDMFSGGNTLPIWVRRAFPEAVEGIVDRELLVDQLATPETTTEDLECTQHSSCLLSFIGIGVQCTRQYPGDRPTMEEVEAMLEKIVYGRAYGNLEEYASVHSLLSASNGVGHQNSGSTSFTDPSQSI